MRAGGMNPPAPARPRPRWRYVNAHFLGPVAGATRNSSPAVLRAACLAFHRAKERSMGQEVEFLAPRWINWPTSSLFGAKAVAVLVGYLLLLFQLGGILGTA